MTPNQSVQGTLDPSPTLAIAKAVAASSTPELKRWVPMKFIIATSVVFLMTGCTGAQQKRVNPVPAGTLFEGPFLNVTAPPGYQSR